MKKTLLALAAIATFTFNFSACNKKKDHAGQPATAKHGEMLSALTAGLTPGEAHNAILAKFIEQHGLMQDSTITYNGIDSITRSFACMMAAETDADTTMDVDSLAAIMMLETTNTGLFVNGSLVMGDDFLIGLVAAEPSAAIRAALAAIVNQKDLAVDYLTYGLNELSALTGLTAPEQERVAGGKSVMKSSYAFWSGKMSTEQKLRFIANADYVGWHVGYAVGMGTFKDWNLAMVYAEYDAARYSYIAAGIAKQL